MDYPRYVFGCGCILDQTGIKIVRCWEGKPSSFFTCKEHRGSRIVEKIFICETCGCEVRKPADCRRPTRFCKECYYIRKNGITRQWQADHATAKPIPEVKIPKKVIHLEFPDRSPCLSCSIWHETPGYNDLVCPTCDERVAYAMSISSDYIFSGSGMSGDSNGFRHRAGARS